MEQISSQHRAALETNSRLLRARERSLQQLAQSERCTNRAEAELELDRVRAQLTSTYSQLREQQPDGSAGPRYPRG